MQGAAISQQPLQMADNPEVAEPPPGYSEIDSEEHIPLQLAGPRDQASGPRDQASGPRDQASGPRDQASGPRDQPSGPRDQASGPRHQASGPRDQASGSISQEELNLLMGDARAPGAGEERVDGPHPAEAAVQGGGGSVGEVRGGGGSVEELDELGLTEWTMEQGPDSWNTASTGASPSVQASVMLGSQRTNPVLSEAMKEPKVLTVLPSRPAPVVVVQQEATDWWSQALAATQEISDDFDSLVEESEHKQTTILHDDKGTQGPGPNGPGLTQGPGPNGPGPNGPEPSGPRPNGPGLTQGPGPNGPGPNGPEPSGPGPNGPGLTQGPGPNGPEPNGPKPTKGPGPNHGSLADASVSPYPVAEAIVNECTQPAKATHTTHPAAKATHPAAKATHPVDLLTGDLHTGMPSRASSSESIGSQGERPHDSPSSSPPQREANPRLKDKNAYVIQASKLIGRALQYEQQEEYQEAFDLLKAGVDLLLNGVQSK